MRSFSCMVQLAVSIFSIVLLHHHIAVVACCSRASKRACQKITQAPDFPSDASTHNLTIPEGFRLRYVGVGFGTQNYTCSLDAGKLSWKPLGALAELRDITNITKNPASIAKAAANNDNRHALAPYPKLATHYFVPRQPVPLPAFFFEPPTRSENPNAVNSAEGADYVVVAKIGSMPSPKHSDKNVAWLALKAIEGDAARLVFRTNTQFGMPPALEDCSTEGTEINQRYSALYWFYH